MNLQFALGALAMLAVVTFAPPAVAAWPSEKLRQCVAWSREKLRQVVAWARRFKASR